MDAVDAGAVHKDVDRTAHLSEELGHFQRTRSPARRHPRRVGGTVTRSFPSRGDGRYPRIQGDRARKPWSPPGPWRACAYHLAKVASSHLGENELGRALNPREFPVSSRSERDLRARDGFASDYPPRHSLAAGGPQARRLGSGFAFSRAPIAQLDRASGCGPEGRMFESCWARQIFSGIPTGSDLIGVCIDLRGGTPGDSQRRRHPGTQGSAATRAPLEVRGWENHRCRDHHRDVGAGKARHRRALPGVLEGGTKRIRAIAGEFQVSMTIRCKAKLGKEGSLVVLGLPKSALLPGKAMAEGVINHFPFRSALRSGQLVASQAMLDAARAAVGDTVLVEITRVGDEPEARVPRDLTDALDADSRAREGWESITPLARRDWILSITTAKKPETRNQRIAKACDMLASGKRRLCCFPGINWMTKGYMGGKVERAAETFLKEVEPRCRDHIRRDGRPVLELAAREVERVEAVGKSRLFERRQRAQVARDGSCGNRCVAEHVCGEHRCSSSFRGFRHDDERAWPEIDTSPRERVSLRARRTPGPRSRRIAARRAAK
jgi:hypothetical protein